MTNDARATSLTLTAVRKSYGSLDVIHGVDLTIGEGEFVVFVGPSGCGKSTLLRMIAGLEEVTDGEIAIKGRDVTDLDPSDRGIAMVFQSYALYPHMSVRDNLAFGLKMSRTDAAEIQARVRAGFRNSQDRASSGPAAGSAFRRAAAARGDRQGHRAQA